MYQISRPNHRPRYHLTLQEGPTLTSKADKQVKATNRILHTYICILMPMPVIALSILRSHYPSNAADITHVSFEICPRTQQLIHVTTIIQIQI